MSCLLHGESRAKSSRFVFDKERLAACAVPAITDDVADAAPLLRTRTYTETLLAGRRSLWI